MKKKILWLDDIRKPPVDTIDEEYVWVKDFYEFQCWILENGMPDALDLDHDLGEYRTGYDCLKFCIGTIVGNNLRVPDLKVHSANPVGKENMLKYYENFLKHSKKT